MVMALPLRVTLAVAGGLAGAWAKLAEATRMEHATDAKERRNIGESLFLGGVGYGVRQRVWDDGHGPVHDAELGRRGLSTGGDQC